MTSEAEPVPTSGSSDAPGSEKNAQSDFPSQTITVTTPVKPIKKTQSKKDLKNDPSRFQAPGVNFNAKLIGVDDVSAARGDKMCQEAMVKLKMAVRMAKEHKQKIVVNVSIEGIKIIDVKTLATNFTHPVHKISFISRDVTDSRAFGYVYGVGDGTHKFFAIKTEKAAEGLVLSLRDLFQVVYEMKKKEMEAAKAQQDEPEKAEEVKAEETKANGMEVSKENAPVENGGVNQEQANATEAGEKGEGKSALLDLEEELQTLGEGIEQINTMESLFADFDSPTSTSASSASSTSNPWAELLSAPQPPAASTSSNMFSIGGAPFSTSSPFSTPTQGSTVAGGGAQGFPPAGLFGQPHGQMAFPPSSQGGFGAASPFGAPTVPPRTGMMAPGGFPAPGFPGTPFPAGRVSPGFPGGSPVRPGTPSVAPPAVNDPFASDPFSTGSGFGDEDVMQPAKLEKPEEKKSEVNKPKDAFDDLCAIGSMDKRHKSPKDMFHDLSTPPKKSLNELKKDETPAKGPQKSPFQASDPFGVVEDTNFDDFNAAFPGASNDPFDTSFVPSAAKSSQNGATQSPNQTSDFSTTPVSHNPSAASASAGVAVEASPSSGFFSDDDFNLPSPSVPPPPLPALGLVSTDVDQQGPPAPPPRPHGTPPLPPRPKSSSSSGRNSVSSISSISESMPMPNNPPVPPRPKVSSAVISTNPSLCTAIPRPRPSATESRTSVNNSDISNISTSQSPPHVKGDNLCSSSKGDNSVTPISSGVTESQANSTVTQEMSNKTVSVSISDPFVTTDPFESEDPFTSSDPFCSDPFGADPFSEPASNCITSSDPFIAANPSPASTAAASANKLSDDPFAVFDKAFNSEPFTFEKSNKVRVKLKAPVTK